MDAKTLFAGFLLLGGIVVFAAVDGPVEARRPVEAMTDIAPKAPRFDSPKVDHAGTTVPNDERTTASS